MTFFDRVKKLAEMQGMTIGQFTQQTITDSSSPRDLYNGWKKRNCIPRGDICYKMAKRLGCSVEFLLTGEDKIDVSYMNQCMKYSDLIELLPVLSDDNYSVILAAAKKMAEDNTKK